MSDEHHVTELSAEEEQLFRSLNRELAPPAHLEGRLVEVLHQRGLLRSPPWRAWRAVAAAAVLLTVGFLAGRWQATPPADSGDQAGSTFMLLLYEDPAAAAAADPQLARRRFDEYAAWAAKLRARGSYVGGDPLANEGRLLRDVEGEIRESSGLAPADEVLTGYFMIRARDAGEAVGMARDCPHLGWDGTVAVRPVGH